MTHETLDQVANINGGGLSVVVSGKYTSVRHERARIDGKHTAGESVKILKKQGIIISAKELVSDWKILTGSEPEWHHAGFYKPQNNKRKCMGRTFFFTDQNLYHYAANIDKIKSIKDKIEQDLKAKSLNLVAGFYWIWDHDYNGRYGKRVNFKRLCIYQGSELNAPKGFVKCDFDEFACAEMFQGAKYYGWDEPSKSEFTKERYENELKRKIKQKKVDSKNYVKRLRLEFEKSK